MSNLEGYALLRKFVANTCFVCAAKQSRAEVLMDAGCGAKQFISGEVAGVELRSMLKSERARRVVPEATYAEAQSRNFEIDEESKGSRTEAHVGQSLRDVDWEKCFHRLKLKRQSTFDHRIQPESAIQDLVHILYGHRKLADVGEAASTQRGAQCFLVNEFVLSGSKFAMNGYARPENGIDKPII